MMAVMATRQMILMLMTTKRRKRNGWTSECNHCFVCLYESVRFWLSLLFFSEPVIEKIPSEKLVPTTKKQPAVKPQDLEYFNKQITTATDSKDFENKSVNTSKHEAEKAKIELRFFEILESDDLFVGLADIVMDEDNVPTRRMYSLVNGIKSKSKYKYLNAVCLCFSRDYKMQTALKLLPDA